MGRAQKHNINNKVPISGLVRYTALLAVALTVSACGGGGSSGDSGSAGTSSNTSVPSAVSGAVQTNEDVAASGTLNAHDANGDALTYIVVSQGSKGTVTITDSSTGAYTYTPNANQFGSDNFTFKVNDGTWDSNTATMAVTIISVNDAPVTQPGTLVTSEDTAGAGTLVANDVEMQPLTFSIDTNGSLGTATITNAATGSFVYVPNPDANGTDSFTFTASDGLLTSAPETVSVTITPVNDAPVANGTCGETRQAQTYSGTLSGTDAESPTQLMYALADGSAGPFTTSKGGQVTITDATTGAFTYTPGSGGDGRGRDSFGYKVIDPGGLEGTATETVIVDQTIMPLGDSITQGTVDGSVPPAGTRVGFRKPLYDLLKASGYAFDLVGSRNDGFDVPDFDFDHEGWGGWTAYEIAWGKTGYPTDGVRKWLEDNPADIILLHIGTNNLNPANYTDVASILDQIDQWENSAGGNPATVVLAKIIDQNPQNPDVVAFNNNVESMANNRIANGDDIIIVDQYSALNYPDDMASPLHPTPNGYSKMANVWFNTLSSIVDKCP